MTQQISRKSGPTRYPLADLHAHALSVNAHDSSASELPAPLTATAEKESESTAQVGSAVERLLGRFESMARRIARARGLQTSDIDEVLQDVRIRLWRSQQSSEKIEALGASYLMRVVSSAVIDHLRTERRRRTTSLDAIAPTGEVPGALQVPVHDFSEREALATRLGLALEQLHSNRRVVVQLHLEGYEQREIGRMTGWTEAKVRNLLYRGLDDLRTLLNQDGGVTR